MKIWITGIAGFLGSHLAERLIADGHNVYGNDSLICGNLENIPSGCVFTSKTDCRDHDQLFRDMSEVYKLDAVVHTAATAAEGFSVFSPSFITRNIYEASVATFSAAISSGVKRIVHMSSMARYGCGRSEFAYNDCSRPFHEEYNITAPIDPYGIAKVAAEDTLKVLADTHGVKYSILVPHNIIGTRQQITPYRNVATIFLNRLKLGLPVYIYGDGEQKRCFSPVSDCIPSIIAAVNGAGDGEVINIGPDNGEITINELLGLCEEVTGVKADRVYLPPRPVTDNAKNAYCSSDKARKLLGYKSTANLRACLEEMAREIKPSPFSYDFPIEIMSNKLPRTWGEKL